MLPSVILRSLYLGLALLLICSGLTAQSFQPIAQLVQNEVDHGTQFVQTEPFTIIHNKEKSAVELVPHAQFLTLNHTELHLLAALRPKAITLDLPYRNEHLILDLVRVEVTTDDFKVVDERETTIPIIPGAHYRGILRDNPAAIVAISCFDDEIMGLIADPQSGNLVLGKLDIRNNTDQYILYADRDMTVKNPFSCQVAEPKELEPTVHIPNGTPEVAGCVRVFLEADNELFTDKGSSVQATVNYLTGVYNQLATLYANDQVNTVVSQILVWTTPDIYPTSSSAAALELFRTFRTSFNGDLAHLVGTGGNNLGGIAYIDVLCQPSYNRAFSDIGTSYSNVPTYSWTVEVMTHEMGHNLGSHHTQWCGWTGGPIDGCVSPEGACNAGPAPTNGGTIMSYCHLTGYGINFNNGFGTQPGNVIRNRVSASSCLSSACATASSCGAPADINVSGITGSSAVISWAAVSGATSYALRYRVVGAAQWTTIAGASSPYTISGLPSNDEIEATVQSVCGGSASEYLNGVLFKTTTGGGGSSCNAPTGLAATPATTSANISWTAVAGASSYSISWKTTASGTWGAAVAVTSTTYNITGLTAATAYDVRLQTTCSGTISTYTTTSFTTNSASASCGAPTGVAASPAITNATISWGAVSGATSYKIQWKANAVATWSAAVTLTNTNYNITGLVAATTYNVRVQSVCASGTSAYTTANFTTLANGSSCGTPTNLAGTTTASTAAMVWTGVSGASSYKIQWKLTTSATWNTAISTTATAYTISGLAAATTYNVRLQTVCASGVSGYITTNVTTQAGSGGSCNAPTGFGVTGLIANSATVYWNAMPGALNYTLQVKRSDLTNWITFNNLPATTVMIQSLTPGTSYDVRVRTNCSGGAFSAYTATLTFVTATNLPGGETAAEAPVTERDLIELPLIATMRLAPNPATDQVIVSLNLPKDLTVRVQLVNSYGKMVQSATGNFQNGTIELEVANLPSGMYFVQPVADGLHLPAQRLMIIH